MDEQYLINELSDYYLDILTRKVVYAIRQLPKEAMQSGDDSPLLNMWDEICVQVQGEEFYGWDLYLDLIEQICRDIVDEQPVPVQHLLSYVACNETENDYIPDTYYPEEARLLLKNYVLGHAKSYNSKRISRYLDRYLDEC